MAIREQWGSRRTAGLLAAGVVLWMLCGVLPAGAQGGGRSSEVVGAWERRLTAADSLIREGKWKKALRESEKLLGEMKETLGGGQAAALLVARAEAVRALSRAGLGEEAAALWDWQVAVALAPAFGELDLAPYGPAGAKIAALRSASAPDETPAGSITRAPEKDKGKSIQYPRAKLAPCELTPVEVSALVGIDGLPRQPDLDPEADVVLGFVALEALRSWKFEPAQAAGKPAVARFTLATDLSEKRCRDLLATMRPDPSAHDFSDDDEE